MWGRFAGAGIAILAGALLAATPAAAQFSKSWKFLQAVKDKDGQEVTDQLADPASTIINTHDSSTGETALHIVTARRDLTWMEFLIAKGADVNVRDNRGVSPLVLASNIGFVEGVDALVRHGAHTDEPSQTGETPLISAVHRRDLAMMRVLLAGGANPDRTDNTGRSAREYAALAGKNNPMMALIENNAKNKGNQSAGAYGPSL